MRAMLILGALVVAACSGDPSYELSYRCQADAGVCPAVGRVCPTVPLASDGCDDIPSVLGHDGIPADAGRPLGCIAALPFGNPSYGNSQVDCVCAKLGTNDPPHWLCPI